MHLSNNQVRLLRICAANSSIDPPFWSSDRKDCRKLREEYFFRRRSSDSRDWSFELTGWGLDFLRDLDRPAPREKEVHPIYINPPPHIPSFHGPYR